jgi:4-hydroxybenzoate polyprenyltransferase
LNGITTQTLAQTIGQWFLNLYQIKQVLPNGQISVEGVRNGLNLNILMAEYSAKLTNWLDIVMVVFSLSLYAAFAWFCKRFKNH